MAKLRYHDLVAPGTRSHITRQSVYEIQHAPIGPLHFRAGLAPDEEAARQAYIAEMTDPRVPYGGGHVVGSIDRPGPRFWSWRLDCAAALHNTTRATVAARVMSVLGDAEWARYGWSTFWDAVDNSFGDGHRGLGYRYSVPPSSMSGVGAFDFAATAKNPLVLAVGAVGLYLLNRKFKWI